MRPPVVVIALVAAITPLRISSQSTPAPLVVRGVVTSVSDGQPLRGARVAVSASGVSNEPVATDADGRFAVAAPPGALIVIRRAGLAPAAVDPRAVPNPDDVRVPLERGGVLTGFVLDELGFPVTEARVRARRLGPPAVLVAAGLVEFTADTDDSGAYRVGSLPPGRYSLHTERPMGNLDLLGHVAVSDQLLLLRMEEEARLRRQLEARIAVQSDVLTADARAGEETVVSLAHRQRAVLPPDAPIGGVVAGLVFDEFGAPAEGLNVRLWRVRYTTDRVTAAATNLWRHTDDRGSYRFFHVAPGRYLVQVTSRDGCCAPVYYPGETAIARAVPLVVGRRQEIPGIDLAFTRSREARVFGFAIGAGGEALQGTLSLVASRRSGAIALPARTTTPDANGVFEFLNVPPGEYVLKATVAPRQQVAEFGMQFVTVDGREMPPVTITAGRPATVTGRVVLEGDTPGVSPGSFPLAALPDADTGPSGAIGTATTGRDGRFEMRGLAGWTRFAGGSSPAGWWLKALEIDGVNAAETPVRFAGPADSRADVTAVFSNRGGAIAGRVTDERGQAVDDYRVLAFSVERGRWFARSPFVRFTGGPEADGGFSITTLPPGDYFVVALDEVDGDGGYGEWQDPDFLEMLATSARRVSLAGAQRVGIDLRLMRLVR